MRTQIHSATLCASLLAALSACSDTNTDIAAEPAISLTTELGGSAEGYQRACNPREFTFPADHGAHPEYRNEWWYVTGNLNNESGQRFGFHATFFRIANQPETDAGADAWQSNSNWAASQFYMGHFAISEEGAAKAAAHERFARAAAGLAGATAAPVKVWLDDWRLTGPSLPVSVSGVDKSVASDTAQWQLIMASDTESVDLSLSPQKPPVLQGDQGLSVKSDGNCNASYYYSISRLQVSGEITNRGESHSVIGSAWLDREWSSSVLADHQVGWDWFALQLTDGRDLMIYQLRDKAGRPDTHSYAVEIDKTGKKKIIPFAQIDLNVERWWQSPSGARYPVAGRIHRADTNETIAYRPLIDNQELPLTVRYWEGAILLTDDSDESIGHGYLELTGY
jgi:predicted secreted hydrolase